MTLATTEPGAGHPSASGNPRHRDTTAARAKRRENAALRRLEAAIAEVEAHPGYRVVRPPS